MLYYIILYYIILYYIILYYIILYYIILYSHTQLYILLDILGYNSSYMFRPNSRTIFRLLFEQVERAIDNAFNLPALVLQELVKISVVCYIKKT